MDNLRVVLWAALVAVLFYNYEAWQHDYGPAPGAETTTAASAGGSGTAAPVSHLDDLPSVGAAPAAPSTAPPATAAAKLPAAALDTAAAPTGGATITVRTDVLELKIATLGGEISSASLLKYPQHKDSGSDTVRLLADGKNGDLSLFQWGLTAGGSDAEPNHKAQFSSPADSYTLKDRDNELTVPLTWTNGAGLTVTRTLKLTRGSYAIALDQHVDNAGTAPWAALPYARIVRHWEHVSPSMWDRDPEKTAFRGPVFFNGTKVDKLNVEKADADRPPATPVSGGWAAAMQHYFVVAYVPDAAQPASYDLKVEGPTFSFRVAGATSSVAPGASADFRSTLWVGPKLQEELAATAPKLELTADYGRLTIIAKPLFWLLAKVHDIIGNWGFTIILVTLLIKLAFYPLAQTSGRSMAKMRQLQPRMKAIQDRYKDDREQLGKQMMELYKREKINPLAGCLPIVVQIPVFLAFYWVLLESVEMRQAPFILWVQDLSTRDTTFVLPIIMGLAMFGQFKLNPTSPDPVQAKVFAFMPLVMTAMMAFFPSGLVLYWITNTALSIAQQWNINRVVAADSSKRD
jgi:YidC/Oxa1 family membrane protein insertase